MGTDEAVRITGDSASGVVGSAHRSGDWCVLLWSRTHNGQVQPIAAQIEPWRTEFDTSDQLGKDPLSKLLLTGSRRLSDVPDDAPALSVTALRGVSPTKLIAARAPKHVERAEAVASWSPRSNGRVSPDDLPALRYVEDAALFAYAVSKGYPKPVEYVQRELGHRSRQTTQNRLNVARKKHQLLTPTTRGKASGELTDKGRRLLSFVTQHDADTPEGDD